MRNIKLVLLAFSVLWANGCSSFEIAEEPSPPTPMEATVEVGEVTFESPSLLQGCVETVGELPESPLYSRDNPYLKGSPLIVVLKEARRIMLFSNGKLHRYRHDNAPSCWKIALGIDPQGLPSHAFDKRLQGDRRTPEGFFRMSDKPWSSYYGAMYVHYPATRQAKIAHADGRIDDTTLDAIARAEVNGTLPPQDTSMGGEILVHGGGSRSDWTWGCIALNNNDLDELRSLLPKSMKTWILIIP